MFTSCFYTSKLCDVTYNDQPILSSQNTCCLRCEQIFMYMRETILGEPDAVDVLEENELKEVTLSDDLPYFSNK